MPVADDFFDLASFSTGDPLDASWVNATRILLDPLDRTAAEIAASVTPVNFQYPELYVDRYATNTTPNTTDMTAAIQAAIDVAEEKFGGDVIFLASSYLATSEIRMGNFVRLVGAGPFPTSLNFGAAVTGNCIKWETAAAVHVFGVGLENLYINVGANAKRGLYSIGAHQHSSLRRVKFANVNQIGCEFGPTGGPTQMDLESVWITAGSADPITTTLDVAASSTDTVIPVTSTAGFAVGDHVSVELDTSTNGLWHHSTIASISAGVSITLDDAIPSDASIGNVFKVSRIGVILNNGSKNAMHHGFDVEGSASFPFDICVKSIFGHIIAEYIHSEDSKVILHAANSAERGGLIKVGVMTGGAVNGEPDVVLVAPDFIGSIDIGWIIGSVGWRVVNRINGEAFGNVIYAGGYQYTSEMPLPSGYAAVFGGERFPSYTVTTLPSALEPGRIIYVTDETDGAVPAFSDGTNWRRITDRIVVS
jgi:hypothetical protein